MGSIGYFPHPRSVPKKGGGGERGEGRENKDNSFFFHSTLIMNVFAVNVNSQ